MSDADVRVIRRFPFGIVRVPASKSVAHRALICAALSGADEPENLSGSEDIEATVRCMRALQDGQTLDCGESGTTLRLLIPLAAVSEGETAFAGRGRLFQRPLAPLLTALSAHGMRYDQRENGLTLQGPLRPGRYEIPGDVSSQYLSGLLLALPLLPGDSEIHLTTPLESAPYVDLTLDMMERFGVTARREGERAYHVPGGQRYAPARVVVEGDYSQAAFFLAAGVLGRPCECRGLAPESRQGDRAIVGLLRAMGSEVAWTPEGGLIAKPCVPRAMEIDVSDIPDLVPPLAALLCFAEGTSRLTGAARLRLKESDRLSAVARALSALGADVREEGTGLTIRGVRALSGGEVDSANDHRIAMMGAVAAIRSAGPVAVRGARCVAKSYPAFWADFEKA